MAALSIAEQKVLEYVKKAPFPVSESDVGKAFAKTVPRATTFLAKLYKHGYISVERVEHHGTRKVPYFYCGEVVNSLPTPTTEEAPKTTPTKGIPTADQTTAEDAPQTTPTNEAPTTKQPTPTTEEALQTTTMEEAPTATELDNPFGGIAENLRAQQEAPEEPISPVATSGQFSEEEGEKLYQEILSGRRYGQIGFSSLRHIIDDVNSGDTDPQTFFEVFRHYYLIMSGREVFSPEAIPDKEVRKYVRAIIGDNDVQSPSQYVFHIVKDKKHFKINKQDISKSQWVSNLQAKATN